MKERLFTLRWKDTAGSLIGVTDREGEIESQEICPTCLKQGMIWPLHDDTEPHKGSPHFKKVAL
jgi:hypothetical protein